MEAQGGLTFRPGQFPFNFPSDQQAQGGTKDGRR